MSEPSVIVTKRSDDPSKPDSILIQTMSPFAQVLVRAARTYLQALVGFLLLALAGRSTLEAVGVVVAPGDFVSALTTAAGLALAPTVIAFAQNLIEILGRLDEKFPKTRA